MSSNWLFAHGGTTSSIYFTPKHSDLSEIGIMKFEDYIWTGTISWYQYLVPEDFATGSTGYSSAMLVAGST